MSERYGSSQSVSVLRCPNAVLPGQSRWRVQHGLGEFQLRQWRLDLPVRHSESSGMPVPAISRRVRSRRRRRSRRSRSDVPVAIGVTAKCSMSADR